MPRGATCSLTSKAITIVGGSTQRSAISPQSRQTAKPHNLVSTFPGEGHGGLIAHQAGALTENAGPTQIDAALRAAAAGLTIRDPALAFTGFTRLDDPEAPLLTR